MDRFDNKNVDLSALKKKAFNLRWAEVEDGVIPLTAADPDYPIAPEIRKAMAEYIEDGYFSYAPKTGLPEFRKAMSKALKERKGEEIDESMILPVDSAARAMAVIAEAFLKPGDEMIVFDPCDFLFREACLRAGGTPVSFPVPLDSENRKMDLSALESCITKKTKMIGLCNPHNPYGLTYTREELDYLMRICEKYDLLIMNDEIWSDVIYPDSKFNSIYCLGNDRCDRVISVFGFSKSFGLAGLRIGAIYCTDQDRFNRCVEASAVLNTQGGATSISQVAAAAAMNEAYYWVDEFREHIMRNRDMAVEYINREIPKLHAYKPKATYLLYVDIGELNMSAADFVAYLRKEHKLAIVPGGHQYFGDQSEGHVRICIATSREILEEGLRRLKAGVEGLSQIQTGGTK
ncbi:MAG: pyridoxal phosphate-dependent aminotransferase [Erysipelotrichaceae bacterium]|nr:pyridoxal phosphate-dependent aminotransferase [Erysipelotrichaceae bacterium]